MSKHQILVPLLLLVLSPLSAVAQQADSPKRIAPKLAAMTLSGPGPKGAEAAVLEGITSAGNVRSTDPDFIGGLHTLKDQILRQFELMQNQIRSNHTIVSSQGRDTYHQIYTQFKGLGEAKGGPTSKLTKKQASSPQQPLIAINRLTKPGLVRWHRNLMEARQRGASSGKPVLVVEMLGKLDHEFC